MSFCGARKKHYVESIYTPHICTRKRGHKGNHRCGRAQQVPCGVASKDSPETMKALLDFTKIAVRTLNQEFEQQFRKKRANNT
jgi:hypothetical protein